LTPDDDWMAPSPSWWTAPPRRRSPLAAPRPRAELARRDERLVAQLAQRGLTARRRLDELIC
jgi:hypothetical protein